MKILITRPIKQAQELAKDLLNLGYEAIISPLLEISHNQDIDYQSFELFDALIITSKNTIDVIAHIDKETRLFILGRRTGDFAKSLGFENVIYMGSNIVELRSKLNKEDKLLYLSGKDVIDDLSEFTNITRQIIYTAKKVEEAPESFLEFFQLAKPKICTLFSLRTAENFLYLVNKYKLQSYCDNIIILALSADIIDNLKELKFKACYVADKPELQSLIALIDRVVLNG